MSKFRSAVSKWLAMQLERRYVDTLAEGRVPSIDLRSWNMLPSTGQKWMLRKVFKPSEKFAWNQLQNHRELKQFWTENPNSFAIGPSTIGLLWNLLHEKRPKRILEFGGGTSTHLSALYAEEMRVLGHDVRVISVDHEKKWADETMSRLSQNGLDKHVESIHAPLKEQDLLGRVITAYGIAPTALQELAGQTGFDFCFIDGPHGNIGRTGALPIAAPFLANGCHVLLDDGFRARERQAVREWCKVFRQNLSAPRLHFADGHGLVTTEWRASR